MWLIYYLSRFLKMIPSHGIKKIWRDVMSRFVRWICLLLLLSTLTSCFYWVRLYRIYLQMSEFDQHFSITANDEFSVYFKDPILYSDDFISLSKLQPSAVDKMGNGKRWRYWFRKVNAQGHLIQPEVKFYFDMIFNKEDRLIRWSFSSLFLQIAPAEFLEVSLRSLGNAKINREKRQLIANTDLMEKIAADLPKKAQVLSQLGEPLLIKDAGKQAIYQYHFQLDTPGVEEGYEYRALSVVKLTFDEVTDEVIKMAGRFVGVKISIDYQKYIKPQQEHLVLVKGNVLAR